MRITCQPSTTVSCNGPSSLRFTIQSKVATASIFAAVSRNVASGLWSIQNSQADRAGEISCLTISSAVLMSCIDCARDPFLLSIGEARSNFFGDKESRLRSLCIICQSGIRLVRQRRGRRPFLESKHRNHTFSTLNVQHSAAQPSIVGCDATGQLCFDSVRTPRCVYISLWVPGNMSNVQLLWVPSLAYRQSGHCRSLL